MARIIWTDSAITDLRGIGEFYERTSPNYASTIVTDLYACVGRLRDFPQSGRVVPELNEEQVREILILGFRIIYEIAGDEVRVLTVLHSRQDLESKLKGDGEG